MRILSFFILAITGLALAAPGFYLATLGGSPYYAIAGVLILLSAWLVLRRKPGAVLHDAREIAERVVRTAPCPVLTVHHPEREFVAPDALVAVSRV